MPTVITVGSIAEPRRLAASTPLTMPKISHSTAAPITSDSVTGAACRICGTTFCPTFTYDVRSRVTNSCFIISR